MRLLQKTKIEQPAYRVWKYVIKPEYFKKWNKKIDSMEAKDEFRLNQFFQTSYKWNNRQISCRSIAVSIVEKSLLELRHTDFLGINIKHEMIIVERVILNERKGKTTVTKDVSIRNHSIPLLIVPIFWLVNRFSSSKELDALDLLCKGDK